MRLGKTALYHFGTQVLISVAGFAATFVIGVVGGPDDLGYYSYAVALGFFWLAIPVSGVSKAIKKRMSEGSEASEYFGAGVLINGTLAASLGALVLACGWVLETVGAPDLIVVQVLVEYDVEVATLLAGATALKTTLAGLEGQKLVVHSGAMKAIERVLRTVVQVALIAVGFGVAAITFGHAASLLVVAVVGLAFAATRPARPGVRHLGSLYEYAKYAWVGALRGRVYGWMDTLMLGVFLSGTAGATLLGVYEVAWGIGSLLATASASISSTLFPEMSDLSSDGNYGRVAHFLDEGLAFSGLIVVPGLVGAITVGDRVLAFYRPEYVQGQVVLVILVGAYVADVYASQLLNAVNAIDRPDAAMRVNVAFVLTNVTLNAVLIWQIGWIGAAIATATSAAVRTLGSYWVIRRTLDDASFPVRPVGEQALAAVVMGATVLAIDPRVPTGRIWTLLVIGGGAGVYFATLLLVSGRLRSKVRSLAPTPA